MLTPAERKQLYTGQQWRRLRSKIIAASPECAWCGRTDNLTVDHINPLGLNGDPYDVDNLQVLCAPHNSAKKDRTHSLPRTQLAPSNGNETNNVTDGDEWLITESENGNFLRGGSAAQKGQLAGPSPQRVTKKGSQDTPVTDSNAEVVTHGHTLPRVATCKPDLASPELARVEAVYMKYWGRTLDNWQRIFVAAVVNPQPNGFPPAEVAMIASRQNGKSEAMLAVILTALLEGKKCILVAHNLKLSGKLWLKVTKLFDPKWPVCIDELTDLFESVTYSKGYEILTLTNGGAFSVSAATPDSARGLDAIDIVWLDESRSLRDFDAIAGLEPVMTVSPAPQLIQTSNAGTKRSVVLNQYRERALAKIKHPDIDDPLVWLEWSAHPDRKLTDREGWAEANPNMGYRFPAERIATTLRTFSKDLGQFRMERLCQWVTTDSTALDVHGWNALTQTGLTVADFLTRPVMAVGVDPYRRGATIYLAAKISDDQIGLVTYAELAPQGTDTEVSDQTVADAIVQAFEEHRPTRIGVNSFIAKPVVHLLARTRLPIEDMKGGDYFTSCRVLDEIINTGRLVHDDNETADDQIGWAAREELRNGNGWFLSRKASPGPVYSADAVAMATYLATRPAAKRRLAVAVGA